MIDSILQFFATQLSHFSDLGYILAFLLALTETIVGLGMLMPGSTILIFLGGYAAATGNLDFFDLVFFTATGAILGDNFNYFLGEKFGKKWMQEGFWILKPSHFTTGRTFFKKHGGKSVLLGRFVPMVKEIVPFIAGSLKMNHFWFFIFNFLGGIGWAFEFLGLGFVFSGSILLAQAWLGRIAFLIFLLSLFFFLLSAIQWTVKKYGKIFWLLTKSFWRSVKKFFIEKPFIKQWLSTHPKIIKFFENRLSPKKFEGLPSTILILLFLYFLALFLGLAEDFLSSEMIVQIDNRLVNVFLLFRSDVLISIFLWITLLGKTKIVIFFTAIATAVLWILKKRNEILPLFLAVLGASGFTFLTKILFQRPRPEAAIYFEPSFSFPSEHATIAVAFYGFLAWLLIKNSPNWNHKINIFFGTLVLIFFIGLSRLYLGVHYLSDVLGGFAVGAMALIFAIVVANFLKIKFSATTTKKISTSTKFFSIVLLILGMGFYIFVGLNYPKTLTASPLPPIEIQEVQNPLDVFSSRNLKFTETITGRETEPINFLFVVKNEVKLQKIFAITGWSESDEINLRSLGKMLDTIFGARKYLTAPITPLFWNGRVQDFAFQKLLQQDNLAVRHHIRVWDTRKTIRGKKIFVGTAVFDQGIKWGITHQISADIDNEREALLVDLSSTELLEKIKKIKLVDPFSGENFSGDEFFTDGKMYFLKLQ